MSVWQERIASLPHSTLEGFEELVHELLSPDAQEDKARFLIALAARGERPEELAGFAKVLRTMAVPFPCRLEALPCPPVDLCGTGGDGRHTFNISTTAAFLVAACGVPVVKHGNRGITSKSGGFDLLDALGIRFDLTPSASATRLEQSGIAFLFAPLYHPAFKQISPLRQACAAQGSRTIFNLLGPLLNPAHPPAQLIGVPHPAMPPLYAETLGRLGARRGIVVCGTTEEGLPMDELSSLGPNHLAIWDGTTTTQTTLLPSDLGCLGGSHADLLAHSPEDSAKIVLQLLAGHETSIRSDIVCLNAAAALWAAGHCTSILEALALTRQVLASGKALALLRHLQTDS